MPELFDLASVTIGADPELFVGKRGLIVSGHALPLGDKKVPRKTENGAVQCDGMAVEVNVKPAKDKFAFLKSCSLVIQDLEKLIKTADPEMYLVCQPSVKFSQKYMDGIPETAKELGCDPDWDAYELKPNERPNGNTTLRTTGGHIHIGWGSGFNPDSLEHIGLCAEVAKQLDYLVGIPSVEWDRDNERRSLYGRAGAFRPKKYGMEYRTLSPVWLLSIAHSTCVFNGTMKALRLLNEGKALDEEYEGLAREIINKNKYNWRATYPELEKDMA